MNVLYCLRRAAQLHGSKVALHLDSGTVTWTEFHQRVQRRAGFLHELGLKKGDRVATLMLNSPEYLELYYATAMAGIVIVPINTRWHVNDIAFTLNDSGAVGLVLDDHFAFVAEQVAGVPFMIHAGTGPCPEGLTAYGEGAVREYPEPDAGDLVGLFYTSGTTGGPKGVMLTHSNVWSNAVNMLLTVPLDDIWLHAAPMFHLADLGATHAVTAKGGAHAFISTFDPEAFMQAVQKFKVTDTVLVPTMLGLVLNHPSFPDYDLSSLKRPLYGASPMPLPLLHDAMKKMPGAKFRQGYGLTESSPLVSVLDYEDHFGPAVTSAGKPVSGNEVRIVDDLDRDVGTNEVGEVIVRGSNIMKGYWKRPEISAEVLRGGWLHTGDLGKMDENNFLYILDRKKDMIKPGGENVYSPEVESMVASHPAVLEAAVIGVPHEKWGETIRAVVACRTGMSVSEAEIVAWCRERMTHFKCPTSVVFVEALPKGGTGKVQKSVLRDQHGRP